eukprot:GDKK01068274.1.p1 GENE.GDKK01068274.1~~GDKK01068274.1.p1  ORF type:complete len:223 (+),score=26.88 GDKK01068274.1:629-1297(+)
MHYQSRRERINAALVAKNSPNAAYEVNAREGRKARQSCIPDYQSLCSDVNVSPSLSKMRQQDDGPADCPTCGKGKKVPALSFEEQAEIDSQKFKRPAAGSSVLVPPPNRKHMKLKGMERCLAKKVDQIQNPVCKDFIEGRQICFGEAEEVCKDQLEKVADTDRKEKTKDKMKMMCLREKDLQNSFSTACANTTYYQSLAAHNAAKAGFKDALAKVRGGLASF